MLPFPSLLSPPLLSLPSPPFPPTPSLPFPSPRPFPLPSPRSRPLKYSQGAPAGSGAEPQRKSNLMHFSFKMTSGGTNFTNFLENQLTRVYAFFLIVFLTMFPLGACTHRPLLMATLAATAPGKSAPMLAISQSKIKQKFQYTQTRKRKSIWKKSKMKLETR